MRKSLIYLFKKGAVVFNKMARYLQAPDTNLQLEAWFSSNGDRTLRMDYDLDADSIVFDAGGYEGQWASDLFSRYCCTIYVFEPFEKYATAITGRFAGNPKIKVFPVGLSGQDQLSQLNISDDASSVYKPAGEQVTIQLVAMADFLDKNQVDRIDLLKINIEGGEYDLLEHLIAHHRIKSIGNIQVQFHNFVPDAAARMKHIQEQLNLTHQLTYQYEFVWENWSLRK